MGLGLGQGLGLGLGLGLHTAPTTRPFTAPSLANPDQPRPSPNGSDDLPLLRALAALVLDIQAEGDGVTHLPGVIAR